MKNKLYSTGCSTCRENFGNREFFFLKHILGCPNPQPSVVKRVHDPDYFRED